MEYTLTKDSKYSEIPRYFFTEKFFSSLKEEELFWINRKSGKYCNPFVSFRSGKLQLNRPKGRTTFIHIHYFIGDYYPLIPITRTV